MNDCWNPKLQPIYFGHVRELNGFGAVQEFWIRFLHFNLAALWSWRGNCLWWNVVMKMLLHWWEQLLGGCGATGMCWCNHNNNGNNTTRNWIILLNIISIKKGITQHNLDRGATLTLFKEIQALGWLNFVIGADLLWFVSPRIQQPNKCCMARTTSAQSVQAQSSTRKNTLPCQESLYFFSLCVLL